MVGNMTAAAVVMAVGALMIGLAILAAYLVGRD